MEYNYGFIMGLDFYIVKPGGEREWGGFMSYGSYGAIIGVAEQAEVDTSEYCNIIKRESLNDVIIALENVHKILLFYRNLLEVLNTLKQQGIYLLNDIEELSLNADLKKGKQYPRETYESTTITLRYLIELCEKTIAMHGSLVVSL